MMLIDAPVSINSITRTLLSLTFTEGIFYGIVQNMDWTHGLDPKLAPKLDSKLDPKLDLKF